MRAYMIRQQGAFQETAKLEGLGVPVTRAEHSWVCWRSRYVADPEGTTVEWVCDDKSVG